MIGINRRAGGYASNRKVQYSAIDRGWLAIGRGWSERQGASKISWVESDECFRLATRFARSLAVCLFLTLLPLAAEKAGPAWLILAVLTILCCAVLCATLPQPAHRDLPPATSTSYPAPPAISTVILHSKAFPTPVIKHHRQRRHPRALTSGASAGGKQSEAWAAAIPSLASVESGWALVLDGWAGRADKRHGLTTHSPPPSLGANFPPPPPPPTTSPPPPTRATASSPSHR